MACRSEGVEGAVESFCRLEEGGVVVEAGAEGVEAAARCMN